ncbi:integrin-alpha FG-GAP repeat-containing protein 2-like protein [Dinothrombium tinctorium]|uniref:Integrin-alpha FG-GAP repeat-containing protein 2-like protein n=1 Tax=Dinothrombium tinctorium TaxID=1965070 RepID=A0A443R2X2_9ACAR|nr:integrin-alpha FG-GAP repeat-containing protein 2-like protein [Dinothrombium tinctorium]
MKCISLVDRIKFEFEGNIHKNAIAFGDVDNDSCNELVVGNLAGALSIFKGMQSKPWAFAQNLGMISSVIVGDIMNINKNMVVSISTEGSLYLFNVSENLNYRLELIKLGRTKSPSVVSCGEEATEYLKSGKTNDTLLLKAFHNQRLPANTKTSLLADIDNDGNVELVVGLTDRVVRTYRWVKLNEMGGKLIGIHKWEFADQIGTISLNPNSNDGGVNIIVSQPGGTYAKLECWGKRKLKTDKPNEETFTIEVHSEDYGENGEEKVSNLTPFYYELDSAKMRNRNISTEIVGGIYGLNRNNEETKSLLAIGTVDGTLMLVDESEILWSLQVDHQVFALAKLDVIEPDKEELIACAWDGQTYIVNRDRCTVRFEFDEPVSAFIAGHYTVNPEKRPDTVPCLVYATFSNAIHLFYNVKLRSTISKTYGLEKFCSELLYDFPDFVEENEEDK